MTLGRPLGRAPRSRSSPKMVVTQGGWAKLLVLMMIRLRPRLNVSGTMMINRNTHRKLAQGGRPCGRPQAQMPPHITKAITNLLLFLFSFGKSRSEIPMISNDQATNNGLSEHFHFKLFLFSHKTIFFSVKNYALPLLHSEKVTLVQGGRP